MKTRKLKICVVASAGGHLSELLRLSACWQRHEVFSITTGSFSEQMLLRLGRTYVLDECNRNRPVKVFKVLLLALRPMFKERPDIVISSGAAVGVVCSLLGKIGGAKIIWMDSIANVKRLSLSGWLVRPFADVLLVQWPELAECCNKSEYAGCVL